MAEEAQGGVWECTCWHGYDNTEKLSHCKHLVKVRNRAAGEVRSKST